MSDFLKKIYEETSFKSPLEYSPLTLAYIGDAVFEVFVRSKVIKDIDSNTDSLHKTSKTYVNAESQAKMYFKIKDSLSEEEERVLKRGRNAKSYGKSKNSSLIDYRHATGIEALFGYLFIKGDTERLYELFNNCIE